MSVLLRRLRQRAAAFVLVGLVAITSSSACIDDEKCSLGGAKCDGDEAMNCGAGDPNRWWSKQCASAAHCKVVQRGRHLQPEAFCAADVGRSPLCPVSGEHLACESTTSAVHCLEGWVYGRMACLRCADGLCEGGRGSSCTGSADCAPGLTCSDEADPLLRSCR